MRDTAVEMGQLWLTTRTRLARGHDYPWSRLQGPLEKWFDHWRAEGAKGLPILAVSCVFDQMHVPCTQGLRGTGEVTDFWGSPRDKCNSMFTWAWVPAWD